MTDTLVAVMPPTQDDPDEGRRQPSVEELEAAQELVRQARDRGVALAGPKGLLKALNTTVIEIALDEEMPGHLGYDSTTQRGGTGATRELGAVPPRVVGEVAVDDSEAAVPQRQAHQDRADRRLR